jgi:hypothetical protein
MWILSITGTHTKQSNMRHKSCDVDSKYNVFIIKSCDVDSK